MAPGPTTAGGAADRSYRLLEGRFDSADQARSTPGYPPLQLVACPADVPSLGSRVLYVEQTRMDAAEAPERQRIYVIEQGDPVESVAVARVFELAEPRSSVGACGRSVRPHFGRDELVERVGCTLSLHADGPVYRGATSGRSCPTTLRGATYVTSDVVLDTVGLRSRERGFDPSGEQKWGAESGPVVFVRRSPPPPTEMSRRDPAIRAADPAPSPAGPQVTDLSAPATRP